MQRANAARPYARLITSVIEDLAAGGAEVDHPLLRQAPEVRNVGFIIITGDRGLAGAYNTSVIRTAERQVMAHMSEGQGLFVVLRGPQVGRLLPLPQLSQSTTPCRASATTRPMTMPAVSPRPSASRSSQRRSTRVELIYTEFVSMGTQRVVVRRFLPLIDTDMMAREGSGTGREGSFEFEPSPEAVLEALLPRYTEARLYGALLDAAASEHASRQRAMKAATDNAEELITKLSRAMNQARQDAITTEIMEIVGGAEALGGGDAADAIDSDIDVALASMLAGTDASAVGAAGARPG